MMNPLPRLTCLLITALLSVSAMAQPPATDSDSDIDVQEHKNDKGDKNNRGDFWTYQEMDESQHNDIPTEGLEYVLSTSHRFANWLDSFFDSDRTVDIKNETRIKLSVWAFREQYGRNDDDDFSFNIRIKLPRALKRAQLIFTNEIDDELSNSRSGGVFPEQKPEDENFAGIRFFDLAGLEKKIPGKISTAMGVGFSSGSPTFRIEPRYVYTHDFNVWSLNFLQKIRWHSRDGWRSQTRLDFDRALSEKWFFRSNNEVLWEEKQEDFDGYEFRPRLILSRRLKGKQALLFELNNLLRSKPDFYLHSTAIAVRYRRQVLRPWLFFEIAPQVAFRDEQDWETTPGVFAKLEILTKKTDK